MFAFIKRHWLAYLIGVAVALTVGFGAAYIVNVKGSTPKAVRAERVEAERENASESDSLANETTDAAESTSEEAGESAQ